jgi:hypothetical protein
MEHLLGINAVDPDAAWHLDRYGFHKAFNDVIDGCASAFDHTVASRSEFFPETHLPSVLICL